MQFAFTTHVALIDARVHTSMEDVMPKDASSVARAKFILEHTNMRSCIRQLVNLNRANGVRGAEVVGALPLAYKDLRKWQLDEEWKNSRHGRTQRSNSGYHMVPCVIEVRWSLLNIVNAEVFAINAMRRLDGDIQAHLNKKSLPKKVLHIQRNFIQKPVTTSHIFVLEDEVARSVRAWNMYDCPALAENYAWEVSNIKNMLPWVCYLNLGKLGYSDANVDYFRMLSAEMEDNKDLTKFELQITWNVDMDIPDDVWIEDITNYLRTYCKMLSRHCAAIQ